MFGYLKIILIYIATFLIILLGNTNFSACDSITQDNDLITHDIKFYGYFEGGDNITYYIDNNIVNVKKGETKRHEFNRFDEAEGVITNIMDIEVIVSNKSNKEISDIEITLVIVPKVARLIYVKDSPPDLIDEESSLQTAKWLKPVVQKSKNLSKINANSIEKIIFNKINLKKIIDEYKIQKKWPIELKIEIRQRYKQVCKKSKRNEIKKFKLLKIPFPAY